MANLDQQYRVREATRIFLRLKQDPENEALLQARDAFISRGEEERGTYFDVETAWSLTARPRRLPKAPVLAWMAVIGVSAYFAYAPLRIAALADIRTGLSHQAVTLASGDTAVLDAASSLADHSTTGDRRVHLLEGAAFFDVSADQAPLTVEVAEVTIRTSDAAFETTLLDGSVLVSVSEGHLVVLSNGMTWDLGAGDQITWSGETGADIVDIATADVAAWRRDRLVIDGLTFAEVADAIDRRLPGQIHIIGPDLAQARMYGGLDLKDPKAAIEALAEAEGARIVSALPAGIVVLP